MSPRLQHRVGLAQVGVHRARIRVVGEQQLAVRDRERLVVDVDDAAAGIRLLRDLVRVADGRDAGADVQELPDAVARAEADGPAQEGAVVQRVATAPARACASSWTSAPASRPSATPTRSPSRSTRTAASSTSTTRPSRSRTANCCSPTTRTRSVHADLRQPNAILEARETRRLLDFDAPVAVLMVALLHFIPETTTRRACSSATRRRCARQLPGHVARDGRRPEREGRCGRRDVPVTDRPVCVRDRAQITELFDGFELVEPGVCTPRNGARTIRTRSLNRAGPGPWAASARRSSELPGRAEGGVSSGRFWPRRRRRVGVRRRRGIRPASGRRLPRRRPGSG